MNLAIDYVTSHLDRPLRLADVSRAAMLSPFHFHRVFQAMVGENLADFVKRMRLERALTMMSRPRRPSLTSIAMTCGFASSSDFSRCFKQRYNCSPTAFDIDAWRTANRIELESTLPSLAHRAHIKRRPSSTQDDQFDVTIRDIPARTVAYIRVRDPYRGNAVYDAFRRLMAWAEKHSLADAQWLGYQWENPEIVALHDCQYHVAVVADRFVASGEIGRFQFPRMRVAQIQLRGSIELEWRVLQWFYGVWLPRSGYVPDDHPGFEAWIGRPFAHGLEHFELFCQIPVKRM